jgi:hypothetical protein
VSAEQPLIYWRTASLHNIGPGTYPIGADPDGAVNIIRQITYYGNALTYSTGGVSIASTNATFSVATVGAAAPTSLVQWEGRIRIAPGDQVVLTVGENSIDWTMSWIVLPAPRFPDI